MVRKPLEEEKLFAVMGERLGLRYRYEEATVHAQPTTTELDLSVLPPELLLNLKAAAEALDMEKALQLVAAVRATHPDLGAALEVLVQGFRFDRIVDRCGLAETGLPARL
jgi:hypothetical protein